MGEALKALIQPMLDFFRPTSEEPKSHPTVGGHKADYSPLSDEEIATSAACDDVLASGDWIPVNRKS